MRVAFLYGSREKICKQKFKLGWSNTRHSSVLETGEGSSQLQKFVQCLGRWPFHLTLVALDNIVEKHVVHDFRSQWVGKVIWQTRGSRFSVKWNAIGGSQVPTTIYLEHSILTYSCCRWIYYYFKPMSYKTTIYKPYTIYTYPLTSDADNYVPL